MNIQLVSCTHSLLLAILCVWLTIRMTVVKNRSFTERVLRKLVALVLILNREASKQLVLSVVTRDYPA